LRSSKAITRSPVLSTSKVRSPETRWLFIFLICNRAWRIGHADTRCSKEELVTRARTYILTGSKPSFAQELHKCNAKEAITINTRRCSKKKRRFPRKYFSAIYAEIEARTCKRIQVSMPAAFINPFCEESRNAISSHRCDDSTSSSTEKQYSLSTHSLVRWLLNTRCSSFLVAHGPWADSRLPHARL